MWEAVSSRVVTVRLKWVGRRQRRRGSSRETSEVFVSVVSAYAPTALAAPGVKVKLAMNCKMLLTKFLDAWHQLTIDVVGKVFAGVIQEHLQVVAETVLPESLCGFFVAHQLLEKAREHRDSYSPSL